MYLLPHNQGAAVKGGAQNLEGHGGGGKESPLSVGTKKLGDWCLQVSKTSEYEMGVEQQPDVSVVNA